MEGAVQFEASSCAQANVGLVAESPRFVGISAVLGLRTLKLLFVLFDPKLPFVDSKNTAFEREMSHFDTKIR